MAEISTKARNSLPDSDFALKLSGRSETQVIEVGVETLKMGLLLS